MSKECRGYRDGHTKIDCKASGGPVGPVMRREVGSSYFVLCRRCADKERALGEQTEATEPPVDTVDFDESNGYMENDRGTVYPYP